MQVYYEDDDDFVDYSPAAKSGAGAQLKSKLSTWAGAAIAVMLIAGIAFWAYRLGVRDADEVPMIRASSIPAKERPADPGGQETPHQNIQAFEVAESGATVRTDDITLAPEPGGPAEGDLPLGELTQGAIPGIESEEALIAILTEQDEDAPERPIAGAKPSENSLILTEAEIISRSIQQVLQETPREPFPPPGEGSEQAPPYSPAAVSRPDDLEQRFAAAAQQATANESDLLDRAASSPYQVQLGAFPERGLIDAEWSRILRENNDILAGRALAVQQTTSGGTLYYRLRVGPFRDAHEANTVCQALKARGQDCLVAINTDRRG